MSKMKPIFCRVGGKYLMADTIIKEFTTHSIYVEPFVGGGGVYWKKEPSTKEVINDKDTELMNGYKLIKKAPVSLNKYRDDLNTKDKQIEFVKSDITSNADKLTKEIILNCGGFSSNRVKNNKIYLVKNPFNKIKKIAEYKKRMANTTVLNKDYKKVIKKYDSDETLFYLDPPYIDNSHVYKHGEDGIDYEEMATILGKLKGKFILSMSENKQTLEIFKKFKIKRIQLKTYATGIIGSKHRIELLIKNF